MHVPDKDTNAKSEIYIQNWQSSEQRMWFLNLQDWHINV
jgi:hypothetical protein